LIEGQSRFKIITVAVKWTFN